VTKSLDTETITFRFDIETKLINST
jgi:hypothetical protein